MIFRNAIKTPDGTIIESVHRHDRATHTDKQNGKLYMVDGGHEYFRRSIGGPFEELSLESTDDHETNRELFTWGTRGKNNDEPLKRVKLKDMSTPHIVAILDTQTQISGEISDIFQSELDYREKKYE